MLRERSSPACLGGVGLFPPPLPLLLLEGFRCIGLTGGNDQSSVALSLSALGRSVARSRTEGTPGGVLDLACFSNEWARRDEGRGTSKEEGGSGCWVAKKQQQQQQQQLG